MTEQHKAPSAKKYVVAPEIASDEFDRMCEGLAIDVDTASLSVEECEELAKLKRLICLAIRDGLIAINEDFLPVLSVGDKQITIREPSGADLMASDKLGRKGGDVAKMHAVLASVTEQPAKFFAGLRGRPYKVCLGVIQLFMG